MVIFDWLCLSARWYGGLVEKARVSLRRDGDRDGFYGSGAGPLTIGVDLHPEIGRADSFCWHELPGVSGVTGK